MTLEESLKKVYGLQGETGAVMPSMGAGSMPGVPRGTQSMSPEDQVRLQNMLEQGETGAVMPSMTAMDTAKERLLNSSMPRFLDGSPLPEGMVPGIMETMDFRDANQNGKEDRGENIYLPRDLVPESSLPPKMNYPDAFSSKPPDSGFGNNMPMGEAQMMQEMQSMSPEDQASLQNMLEQGQIKTDAPLNEIAEQLKAAGTGEDTQLAHLRPGEMVIPPEFLEDTEFESMLEKKYNEFNINPEQAVVGAGIASLNATTGLEEFGFFKKIGKSLKKVAKKVAPVIGPLANFIPGVGPLLSAGISGLTTKLGGGSWKDALKSGVMSYGAGKLAGGIGGLGKGAGAATKTGGNFFGNAKEFLFKGKDGVGLFGNLGSGIGGLKDKAGEFLFKGKDGVGLFGNTVGKGYEYVMPGKDGVGLFGNMMGGQGQPTIEAVGDGTYSVDGQILDYQQMLDSGLMDASGNLVGSDLAGLSNSGGLGSLFGGNPGQSKIGLIEDFLKGRGSDPVRSGGGMFGGGGGGGGGGMFGGGGGGGGMGGLGMLGAGALASTLGKLAYDEAKNAKGVELTPLTTMDASGRYNIEAEIARRTGQQAPNPTEFGLLPQGTFPTLSGGQPQQQQQQQPQGMNQGGGVYPNEGLESLAKVAPEVVERMGYNMGGAARPMAYNMGGNVMPMGYNMGGNVMPMAYATGGNVAVEDFERKNGFIEGPGTETSDDVPAMLSDGEFVMTGSAVRGAGGFQMKNNGGIVTLTPTGEEDRKKGTDLMYEMMGLFENYGTI